MACFLSQPAFVLPCPPTCPWKNFPACLPDASEIDCCLMPVPAFYRLAGFSWEGMSPYIYTYSLPFLSTCIQRNKPGRDMYKRSSKLQTNQDKPSPLSSFPNPFPDSPTHQLPCARLPVLASSPRHVLLRVHTKHKIKSLSEMET